MLVGFSVSNYKSFDKTESVSFLASRVSRHKTHLITVANKKILKSGLIFGANASGKSNLVKAIHFSKQIILKGLSNVNLTNRYFRIKSENSNQPGIFEYRIIVDEKEFSYGIAISYADREIVGEWLVKIDNNGNEKYLFNREIDDLNNSQIETEIDYCTAEEQQKMNFILEGFGENISDAYRKKTILNDIALRATEEKGIFADIRKVYEWFEKIIILFPDSKYNGLNDIAKNEGKREFLSNIISYFDTGIVSVEGEKQQMNFDEILAGIPREQAEKIKIDISNKVNDHPVMFRVQEQFFILRKDEEGNLVYNALLLNHGNDEDLFEYSDESDGTKRLFDLIPLFFEGVDSNVIIIDEIDRSLHTITTRRFLEIFYELSEGRNSQIIATTHDSNLLDLDLLRQDEIWFVERRKSHSSNIFSLNKFKERFDKRIDKEYLLGRYGAIPVFGEESLGLRKHHEK